MICMLQIELVYAWQATQDVLELGVDNGLLLDVLCQLGVRITNADRRKASGAVNDRSLSRQSATIIADSKVFGHERNCWIDHREHKLEVLGRRAFAFS